MDETSIGEGQVLHWAESRHANVAGVSRIWPTQFVAVPTSQLVQDGQLRPSNKATPDEMRGYVQAIPQVYARLGSGSTSGEMMALRSSQSLEERAVGETYFHVFSPEGLDHRIEAEYVRGMGVVVTRGRHRVEAAQHLGVSHLPVHVRAPDLPTLDALARSCEIEVTRSAPRDVQVQRQLDIVHCNSRDDQSRTRQISDTAPPVPLRTRHNGPDEERQARQRGPMRHR